jgi:hypothetical protein
MCYLVSGFKPKGFEWLSYYPWQIWPISLLIIFGAILIWFQFKSSFWLLKTLRNICLAPYYPVRFKDFFLADQILSIVIVLTDFEYTFCFFIYDAWTGSGFVLVFFFLHQSNTKRN